jgi:chromosome segregation protein
LFLKNIEMRGFKTFVDQTKMAFEPGVTVIVGPNGSGKSNIVDALRWVLGEQSIKNLRGVRTEDVIFGGSAKRKAVSMAEVALTLDNSNHTLPLDYSELTVTRRVYRSGESEYLLNKIPYRLKGIQQLFWGTGVGKEGFAVIGQGRVEEILMTKPDERRALLEEVSGIVKYRHRKNETLRKLAEARQDLIRIQDVMQELSTQLEPLTHEVERLKHFQSLETELHNLEKNLALHQLEEVEEKLNQVRSKIAVCQEKELAYSHEHQQLTTTLQQLYHRQKEVEAQIRLQQNELFRLSEDLAQADGQLGIVENSLQSLTEQKERVHKELRAQRQTLNEIQTQLAASEEKYAKLKQEINEKQRLQAENEAEQKLLEEEVKAWDLFEQEKKAELFELMSSLNSLENRAKQASAHIDVLVERDTKLAGVMVELQQAILFAEAKVKSLATELTENQKLLKIWDGKKIYLQQERSKKEASLREKQKQWEQIQGEWQAVSARLRLLREMQQTREGYYASVKQVLQVKELTGIHGVVVELLEVPSSYETAIEVALGGALQHVVTATVEDARRAIQFLKTKEAGRATFLPLDTIQPRKFIADVRSILSWPGVFGAASGLVKTQSFLQGVVEHLLGHILVVENLKLAITLSRRFNYQLKIVTLDGDVANRGGAFTGGSKRNQSASLLGRLREIRTLGLRLESLRETMLSLEQQKKQLSADLERLYAQQEKVRDTMQELQLTLSIKDQELNVVKQELTRHQAQLETVTGECMQLTQERAQKKEEFDLLQVAMSENKNNYQQLLTKIETTQREYAAQKKKHLVLREAITLGKIAQATLKQEEKGLQELLKGYSRSYTQYKAALQSSLDELEKVEKQQQKETDRLAKYRENIENLVNKRTCCKQGLEKIQAQAEMINKELLEKEKQQKLVFIKLTELQGELQTEKIKQARLQVEWENVKRDINERFLTDLDSLRKQDRLRIVDWGKISEYIYELKQAIAELGPVNRGALAEYNRIYERYHFLEKQKEDLESGQEVLAKLITEVDDLMRRQLTATFTAVNDAFQEIYLALFGGGQAVLEMVGADNILEAGLEITAQPPGKKAQHLGLLSGGERALTAIALLFSFLQVNPSPFCILDEIDTSLDEANVARFANFLKKYSPHTQFLVVSHRQGTMEAADALYGVTMVEAGISKLVSVKLNELAG